MSLSARFLPIKSIDLLQSENLPDDIKDQAVERPAVLAKIPPARIAGLLLDKRIPQGCRTSMLRAPKLIAGITAERHLANIETLVFTGAMPEAGL